MRRPLLDVGELSPVLTKHASGIWVSDAAPATLNYPDSGNDSLVDVEGHSFWFRHRNACIYELVRRVGAEGPLLDIGGGNGFVCMGLEQRGFPTILLEPGAVGAKNGRSRGLPRVICSTLDAARLRAGSIPSAGAFDVIEHVVNEGEFLRSVFRVLEPGGWFFATVPAYQWLWSDEDDFAMHVRRYTLRRLRQALEDAGFEACQGTYFFSALVVPIALLRVLPFRLGLAKKAAGTGVADDHRSRGPLLSLALAPEITAIRTGVPIPMGASCLVAGRKPRA